MSAVKKQESNLIEIVRKIQTKDCSIALRSFRAEDLNISHHLSANALFTASAFDDHVFQYHKIPTLARHKNWLKNRR